MKRSIALLLLAASCASPKSHAAPGAGQRVVEGGGQALTVLPRTGALLYLSAPSHPKGKLMPPDAYLGELTLVTPAGAVRALGPAVTNLTGSLAYPPSGKQVGFLEHFDFEKHLGDLAIADTATGDVHSVARDVSYFGFPSLAESGDSVGWISGPEAELKVDGHAVDRDVATFEFVGDQRVLYRLRSAAGGELRFASRTGAEQQTLASRAGDYQVSPDGAAVAFTVVGTDGISELHLSRWGKNERTLDSQVSSFAFSPDGQTLAYVAGVDPHRLLGDLFVLDLRNGVKPQHLGKNAGSYRFAADGRLAFLSDYYEPTRSGKFSLWSPGTGTVAVEDSVRVFGFSPTGRFLGYLRRVTQPLYTEQLMLLPLSGKRGPLEAPRLVGEAIYAFDFTPDERSILYKSACTRGGEACDLMSVPTSSPPTPTSDGGVQKNPLARRLVGAVDDYDFSPDRHWLWLTFKSAIGNTVDLAVIPAEGGGLPRYIDFKAEPGPRWTADGHIAYVVNIPKRAGVYLADPSAARAVDGAR